MSEHGKRNILKEDTFRIVLALALVFGVRILYFFVVIYPDTGDQIRRPDGYWTIAENLLGERGYIYDAYTADKEVVTAKRGPTTVLLFLGLFRLFGVSSWPILIMQWLLEVGTGWLVYRISRLIFPQYPQVGWLAVGLYALFWPELRFTAEARGDILFMFLLLAFFLSLLRALQVNTAGRFVLSGFLLGLAYHTKPVMGLFPIVVLVFLWWLHPENKRTIVKRFAWFCVAFALVLMPWIVRNYLVFQKFIPGTTLLGYVLYNDFRDQLERKHLMQNEDGVWLVPQDLILENTSQADYRLGKSEAELDQLWATASVELIKRYPGEFGLWCLNNVTRFWLNVGRDKWDHPGVTGFSFAGLANAFILVMSVMAYGLSSASRQKLALTLPVLVIYFTAVHAFTSGELRYSIPMIPYLLILTTVALLELNDRFMKRHKPGPKTTVLLEAALYDGNLDAERITL